MHGVERSLAALVRRQGTIVAMQQGHTALAQTRSPSASRADVEIRSVVHEASVAETVPAHQRIARTRGYWVSMPQEGMGVGPVIIMPKPKLCTNQSEGYPN